MRYPSFAAAIMQMATVLRIEGFEVVRELSVTASCIVVSMAMLPYQANALDLYALIGTTLDRPACVGKWTRFFRVSSS